MPAISGHMPQLSVTGRLFIEGEGRVNPGERTERFAAPASARRYHERQNAKGQDFSWPFETSLAGWTGLEPAASGVTGRRYNQLNYHPRFSETTVGATGFEPVTPGL